VEMLTEENKKLLLAVEASKGGAVNDSASGLTSSVSLPQESTKVDNFAALSHFFRGTVNKGRFHNRYACAFKEGVRAVRLSDSGAVTRVVVVTKAYVLDYFPAEGSRPATGKIFDAERQVSVRGEFDDPSKGLAAQITPKFLEFGRVRLEVKELISFVDFKFSGMGTLFFGDKNLVTGLFLNSRYSNNMHLNRGQRAVLDGIPRKVSEVLPDGSILLDNGQKMIIPY